MNEEKISGTLQVTGTINGTIQIGGGGSEPVLQEVTVQSEPNTKQVILPESGYDGFSKITVRKRPLGTKIVKPSTVAQNFDAWSENYYGYQTVTVDAMNLQSKTVTINPSETQQIIVTPDANWDGMSQVIIELAQ